jgi:hypothetical protein
MAEPRREIRRNWKWAPGTDPNDDDAVEGSGWEYVTRVEVEKPPPGGPKIEGQSGPPAGMKCVVEATCQADMFILNRFAPKEMLAHIEGVGGDFVLPSIVEDYVLALACSNGHTATWKESMLPARQRALGRKV